ncbi:hypothetical protein BU24DRAFT_459354 [Aaosphaeria arxii CBS 175.79]|uniref:Uncharacterized protein n=1 Tax=Aaosphaeria arxii CBS 175.79 TaxID=1450172 RepID=A0A6A5Y3B8_9PLEO|nr:uncharacterized protein BU24DRAFT_459354 [Aaosphaeria arxii CBS 175.79]KAF2019713.1 hypothetical protein BU24DRAFT_459354 [Aaosphaeria arxii CBS 175.79]
MTAQIPTLHDISISDVIMPGGHYHVSFNATPLDNNHTIELVFNDDSIVLTRHVTGGSYIWDSQPFIDLLAAEIYQIALRHADERPLLRNPFHVVKETYNAPILSSETNHHPSSHNASVADRKHLENPRGHLLFSPTTPEARQTLGNVARSAVMGSRSFLSQKGPAAMGLAILGLTIIGIILVLGVALLALYLNAKRRERNLPLVVVPVGRPMNMPNNDIELLDMPIDEAGTPNIDRPGRRSSSTFTEQQWPRRV